MTFEKLVGYQSGTPPAAGSFYISRDFYLARSLSVSLELQSQRSSSDNLSRLSPAHPYLSSNCLSVLNTSQNSATPLTQMMNIITLLFFVFCMKSALLFGHPFGRKTRKPRIDETLIPSLIDEYAKALIPEKPKAKPDMKTMSVLQMSWCVGLVPGRLFLALALVKEVKGSSGHSLRVGVVDLTQDKPWPDSYGVWVDKPKCFVYNVCVYRFWKEGALSVFCR